VYKHLYGIFCVETVTRSFTCWHWQFFHLAPFI